MDTLPPALSALAAWPQFVCWFAVPKPDEPGKLNKFPCDWRTGEVIDAHDPAFWTTWDVALANAQRFNRGYGCGAGFVFTAADPFFFLDVDKAYDPAAFTWSGLATQLCARLNGAAVEVSTSGTGLHIIGRSAPQDHGCRNKAMNLELYTSGRFVALTGLNAVGDAAADVGPALASVIADFFPPGVTGDWDNWTAEPVAEYTGPADDDELIRKALASSARNAAAVFGASGSPGFADLWNANVDVLAAWKPGEGSKPFGQSEADQALANALAFWTGKNCDRMERLMRRSALAREKWDQHRTYLANTITQACAFVHQVYTKTENERAPVVPPPSTEVLQGAAQASGRQLRDHLREYMGSQEQVEHFADCYFNNATGKIYSLRKNVEFAKSAFDVNYGGHMFVLDPASQKTTKSAWEAFTESRVWFPAVVDALCFRPEMDAGAQVREGNRVYVNSYVPHNARRLAGDPGPFLRHLEKLLPDERDRAILLHYLASMAQNPGRKFQWWPVLQGTKGNGKTILIKIMTHIVGTEYTHLPNTAKMAKQGMNFNHWMYRKLFIGLEEIKLSTRRDFLDELKAVVTNDRIEVEGKGENQFMGDNRANGLICTNPKDGVPIDDDERRYAVFYTAQQSKRDILRDGMTAAYFADLWDWVMGRGAYEAGGAMYGAAIVAEYLHAFPLSAELDPAQLCTRAPLTSSTAEAIIRSRGSIEQEIAEAIEEGRPGFAGGWVSSKYLDALLAEMRVRLPRTQRREIMQSLGYDYHPHLPDGRVNDAVTPDMAKPRLYVRNGHIACNIDRASEIARLYSKAQTEAQNAAPSPAAVAFAAA